jgi:hypothetical protein
MAGELIIKNGLIVSGSTNILGSIIATSFTGSFSGSITSASYAATSTTAVTASFFSGGYTGTVTLFGTPPPNNLNFVGGILINIT